MGHRMNRLRRWELALLLGLGLSLLTGVFLEREGNGFSDKIIRLHVIAHSDSREDQALKLRVRDRILEEAETLLGSGVSIEETEQILSLNLGRLACAGEETAAGYGYDYPVSASIQKAHFPTKVYPDFSLPAGNYTALRVVIGDGCGENWWCVVFPPLCLGSVSETAAEAAFRSGFDAQDIGLISGENEGYIIKFRLLELWDAAKEVLQ